MKIQRIIFILIISCFLMELHFNTEAAAQTQTTNNTAGHTVQRFEIIVDSYSFKPDQITVKVGEPVEIVLRSVTSIIPHNFSIDDPAAGLDVNVDVPSGKDVSVTFTPNKPGKFQFYCNKKGIFGSHMKKGMVGTIEVIE
jgi:plastocyanin